MALVIKTPRRTRPRRPAGPRVLEKTEQAHIIQTIGQVRGKVYVLGTRRPKGDYQGTRQTPGIPDLLVFLPPSPGSRTVMNGCSGPSVEWRQVWIEAKAAGGRLRPEQVVFAHHCLSAGVDHIVGGLDAVIAWLIREGYLNRDQVAHYRLPSEARCGGTWLPDRDAHGS